VPFFQPRRKRVHVPHREVRDHADAPWLTLLLEAPELVAESDAEIPGLQPYEVAALVEPPLTGFLRPAPPFFCAEDACAMR